MKQISFAAKGTCSRRINVTVEGDTVTHVEFVGGCTGNVQGLAALAVGQKVQDLIDRLSGIQCRNGTSCPDQLAQALKTCLRKA